MEAKTTLETEKRTAFQRSAVKNGVKGRNYGLLGKVDGSKGKRYGKNGGRPKQKATFDYQEIVAYLKT